MSVKVVAITQPLIVAYKDQANKDVYMTAEEFIAYAARVSNPSNQMNNETSGKLLQYCINNKHWSVFEQVFLTLEITTTRDIGRQILRHRSFTFQEFSQRYADPTQDMNFVTREARLQDHKNRQNSIEVDDEDLSIRWDARQKDVIEYTKNAYQWAIDRGIAKEQCRSVLPEGLIETKMYMSGSLRSFIHWIDIRAEAGTQKEHRLVAESAKEEILKHFPSLNEYWYPEGGLTGYDEFAFKQQLLGKEFEKVLYDNLDDLYVTDEKPKSWWWRFWS
jgi:thymidylate synthase (FAD)